MSSKNSKITVNARDGLPQMVRVIYKRKRDADGDELQVEFEEGATLFDFYPPASPPSAFSGMMNAMGES